MTQPDLFDPSQTSECHPITESQLRVEYRALFEQVAARILILCEARGMAPIELVRAAGLDSSRGRGEPGHGLFARDFPLSTLQRIAKALKVTVGDLLKTSEIEESSEVKEAPVYKQHRLHALQLSSALWIVSIVNFGTRKMTNKDSLTGAVTRIPGEHGSEEQAIQAAKEYIDQQTTRETIPYLKT